MRSSRRYARRRWARPCRFEQCINPSRRVAATAAAGRPAHRQRARGRAVSGRAAPASAVRGALDWPLAFRLSVKSNEKSVTPFHHRRSWPLRSTAFACRSNGVLPYRLSPHADGDPPAAPPRPSHTDPSTHQCGGPSGGARPARCCSNSATRASAGRQGGSWYCAGCAAAWASASGTSAATSSRVSAASTPA